MVDFYVTLPSNTQYEGNTTGAFRVPLPHTISLEGDWEVGLVEMQFPRTWYNVTNHPSKHTFLPENGVLLQTIHGDTTKTRNLEKIFEKYTIPAGHYNTVEQLIDELNRALEKRNVVFTKTAFGVRMRMNEAYHFNIVLSPSLQYILGFANNLYAKGVHDSEGPPDLRAGFDTMYIYCDLIEPQICGNTLAPLIRTLPVDGKFGDTVDCLFTTPHYAPVLNKTFNSVQMHIKTDANQPVAFRYGKVVVKLHFRRRR
jgi:hypothetical protein